MNNTKLKLMSMSEAEMIKDNKKCRDMMSPAINRIKRGLDILGSITGMIVFSPLFLLIYLVIKIENGGKVIFSQERIGYQGKPFILYKFRSMKESAEADGKPALCCQGDKRLTRVGRFLREHHLDELPQLWNVLKGDMSLVGPRPEVPRYVRLYSEAQRKVLLVRPGITDLASIAYRNENDLLARSDDPERTYVEEVMPAKLELNRRYIVEFSLLGDLRLIGRTIRTVAGGGDPEA